MIYTTCVLNPTTLGLKMLFVAATINVILNEIVLTLWSVNIFTQLMFEFVNNTNMISTTVPYVTSGNHLISITRDISGRYKDLFKVRQYGQDSIFGEKRLSRKTTL